VAVKSVGYLVARTFCRQLQQSHSHPCVIFPVLVWCLQAALSSGKLYTVDRTDVAHPLAKVDRQQLQAAATTLHSNLEGPA
jgi:hypothetical protein